MNRREFGWALGTWFGYTALRGGQETVVCTINALDAESFREFALRERVKVDLGVPGMPKAGYISAIEDGSEGSWPMVRYRVDLDGGDRQRIWLTLTKREGH